RDLALALFVERDRGLLDRADAADAGTHRAADALLVVLVRMHAGIRQRLHRSRDSVVDEGVHLLDVLRRDVLRRIEITHFARDPRREAAGVEMRDRADAALAGEDVSPRGRDVVADRRNHPESGYHDAFRIGSFHTSVWMVIKRKLRLVGAAS